ncbi:MAG: ChaN family lipoprotein [Oleiphilaceae bacterium]|nr:ChaN family lipoprotein [Oleiphilaceae bacterium]
MKSITNLAAFVLALSVSACAVSDSHLDARLPPEPARIHSLYESLLLDSNDQKALTLTELTHELRDVDVVFIGELHGHNGAHLLQSRLQVALHQQRPRQILSMEQFTADNQVVMDRYLANNIGEATLIEQGDAWDNYQASYRPLVEFARYHDLPVVAANAPAKIVRCVAQEGPDYLEQVDRSTHEWLPLEPFYGTPAYKEKFMTAMSHGSHGDEAREAGQRRYQAQLLRDNTMATAIHQATKTHPDHQVLHLTGRFHIENRLGTVASLAHYAPHLTSRVVTPIVVTNPDRPGISDGHREKGDFLYILRSLPPEYRQADKRAQAMKERFSHQPHNPCGGAE